MGAKSRLFLLLVASLIGFGFALIPATEAETNHKIESFAHFDANIENNIEISVENKVDKEIPYSLTIDVFSEDLQQDIYLESSNLVFSIEGIKTYYINYTFTIPQSGNYLFNLTLLSNDDGVITTSSIENEKTFYNVNERNLEQDIVDFYLDTNDNANWIFNEEINQIELINLEGNYETGIILGPYDTKGYKDNRLVIENIFEKSETAEYSIDYTIDFNSTQLYSTIWTELYSINSESPTEINLGIEDKAVIYVRFLASDSSADETNYWNLLNIKHRYVTIKHELSVDTEEHRFFDIDENIEILINIENTGLFNQQLGNITVSVDLYSKNNLIGTYFRTPNLLSGEKQDIDFRFNNLEAGNYFCLVNISLMDSKLYNTQKIVFLSISTTFLDTEEIDNGEFERINLLIETDNSENLETGANYQTTNLINNYYLIELQNQEHNFIQIEDYRLISAISMDEYRFLMTSTEENGETIEGILAPSIMFESFKPYSANIVLKNEGFYSEDYTITYFFASTFIESLNGPDKIVIEPGTNSNINIEIIPLPKIPREGGSQLRIEVANQYETKSLTYVLSYIETSIKINQQKCNKHSVLLGQDIVCTTTISNEGYNSNQLSVNVNIKTEDDVTEIIDQINIEELKNSESLVLRTTYFPKDEANFRISIDVFSEGLYLTSSEMEENINVVTAADELPLESRAFEAPEIKITQTVFAISFAGIAFQFRRSENFRYLTFKFFIPLYSRLQKDTLADEPTRQRLLNTIYTEPGTNFTLLKEKLGLHNGTLAHHINILENNKMITSHRSGRQRLFFPFGGGFNSTIRDSLITNKTQKDIIQMVKENPGITQSMISQQLKMSRQKINYHVTSLSNNSVLRVEKQGRITRLYPMHFT